MLIGYSAERMYVLVDDVNAYPQFLPWCGGASTVDPAPNTTEATIWIDYHGLRQSFTTHNTKEPGRLITMQLKEGPFRSLNGSWRFTPLGNDEACKIEFQLHYEFSNRILEKLVGPVFSYIANTFIEAFTHRAEKIYGKT